MLRRSLSASLSHCVLKSRIAPEPREPGKPAKHLTHEEREPDTLAFAFPAHHVHAVVPVAGTDEGKAVLAFLKAPLNGPHTVIVEAGRLPRPTGRS